MSTLMSDEALRKEFANVISSFAYADNQNLVSAVDDAMELHKQQQQAAVGEVLGRLEDKAVKAGIPWSGYVSGTTLELAIPLTAIQAERTRNENGGKV